ncbi:GYDIA family GHMP kinase [Aquimarina brevivitae]|uniref:Mevalonate kinase n=1 Tax=Aquimarina brevivitae TaxID=323412 RepID=A0A4Q7PJ78_9FLAO|nr:GYDIA family GHMP kinase [Aquimarina brevivitae]RZS98972.1 mevalonate kinase [Aquimarina brevivitae]
MKESFYSHGKLLLTAEYLVLDGAKALALPTQKGQWLTVEEHQEEGILWTSFDENNNVWYKDEFYLNDGTVTVKPNDQRTEEYQKLSETLTTILNCAKELNPKFLAKNKGVWIKTKLEFNRNWGLGSSSTLINNIAQWAVIDGFKLLDACFGGSGYDIACAQHDSPLIYKRGGKPNVQEVTFNPPFKEQLFFVHLNQKQDSKESIKHYQSLPLKEFDTAETSVNQITEGILQCDKLEDFRALIDQHEAIISKIIKTPTVKSKLFSDYPGSIKSLGGWGGDFVLATGTAQDMEYFKAKGYHTILAYEDMVL